MAEDKTLSGLKWFKANQAKYPNSTKVSDLDSSFKSNVTAFNAALKAAGAKIVVSTTKRNKSRAAIMHWAYKLANGKVKVAAIPKIAGVTINWDHGDDAKSKKAAKDMVGSSGFNIKYQPSLTSRHIQGKAIDMTITWSGELKIQNKKKEEVTIASSPRNGQNKDLHKIGATYGVVKLVSDPPHWSTDGK